MAQGGSSSISLRRRVLRRAASSSAARRGRRRAASSPAQRHLLARVRASEAAIGRMAAIMRASLTLLCEGHSQRSALCAMTRLVHKELHKGFQAALLRKHGLAETEIETDIESATDNE